MPYIKKEDRARVDRRYKLQIPPGDFEDVVTPFNAGELNYMITKLCLQYLATTPKRYTDINDVVGALECCKLEFYRRLAAPYEDEKIKENGDVY